jgi:YfiH family protein
VLRPDWDAPPNVRAAFTLRGSEDPERVNEFHRDLRETLALPSQPAWLEQVHGTAVVNLDASPPARPRADASFTHTAGRVCVVRVADCMPVLLAQKDGKGVGAAHAGWRGLAAGVIEATIAAMGADPTQLCAWLGPVIGPADFEVGDEVREAFVNHSAQASSAFSRNARGRWQCDLYALARQRLEALGVSEIGGGGWSTFSDERFHSFRRNGTKARMAALIWMT